MLCGRCHNVVPDAASVCPACGVPVSGRIDSYAATAFAPAMTPPSPAQGGATAPTVDVMNAVRGDVGSAPTMLSAQAPPEITMPAQPPSPVHPPTLRSGHGQPAPSAPYGPTPMPQYYSPPQPSAPTPYAPPPMPGAYPPPMMFAQPTPRTSAPGLAVAALICGLLGLVPFWIGFLLCLLAITFGAIVLAQSRPGDAGRGMAIAGLVLGLVFVLPAACGL